PSSNQNRFPLKARSDELALARAAAERQFFGPFPTAHPVAAQHLFRVTLWLVPGRVRFFHPDFLRQRDCNAIHGEGFRCRRSNFYYLGDATGRSVSLRALRRPLRAPSRTSRQHHLLFLLRAGVRVRSFASRVFGGPRAVRPGHGRRMGSWRGACFRNTSIRRPGLLLRPSGGGGWSRLPSRAAGPFAAVRL